MNPNDREQLAEQMSAYLDGELSEADNARIREIIETSPDARALLEELRRTVEMVRDLPSESPPDDLYATVVAQLERSALLDGPDVENLSARPQALRWVKAARRLAAAAIILVAVTIGYVTVSSRTDRKPEQQMAQVDADQAQPPVAAPARQKGRAIVHERVPAQPEPLVANGDAKAVSREIGQAPPPAKHAKPASMGQIVRSAEESKPTDAGLSDAIVLAETPVQPTLKADVPAEDYSIVTPEAVALAPPPVAGIVSDAPLAKQARHAGDVDRAGKTDAPDLAGDSRVTTATPTVTIVVTPQSDQAAWRLLMQAGSTLRQQGVDWSATRTASADDGLAEIYRFDATQEQVDALADQLAAVPGLALAVQPEPSAAELTRPSPGNVTPRRGMSFGQGIDRPTGTDDGQAAVTNEKLDQLSMSAGIMAAPVPAEVRREHLERRLPQPPVTTVHVSIHLASPPPAPTTQPAATQPASSQPVSATPQTISTPSPTQ